MKWHTDIEAPVISGISHCRIGSMMAAVLSDENAEVDRIEITISQASTGQQVESQLGRGESAAAMAKRKLIQALYTLVHCGQGAMPGNSAVLGFARRELKVEEFRNSAREWTDRFSRLKVEEDCWKTFVDGLDYLPGLDQSDGFERL